MTSITDRFSEAPPLYVPEKTEALLDYAYTKILEVVLGCFVSITQMPLMAYAQRHVVHIMESYGIQITTTQNAIKAWKSLGSLVFGSTKLAAKISMLWNIVILGPIIEEIIFRQVLFVIIKKCSKNPQSLVSRIIRIVGNGVIFGLCHLSTPQGWINAPIFVVTFLMGCSCAALREGTGNIVASTSAHITHNGLVMLSLMTAA